MSDLRSNQDGTRSRTKTLSSNVAIASTKLKLYPDGGSKLPYFFDMASAFSACFSFGHGRLSPKPTYPMMFNANLIVSCSTVHKVPVSLSFPSLVHHLTRPML